MKGPYERIKYELRRVWECPVCNQHERTGGEVAGCVCACQQNEKPNTRRSMKLIEDGVRRITSKDP